MQRCHRLPCVWLDWIVLVIFANSKFVDAVQMCKVQIRKNAHARHVLGLTRCKCATYFCQDISQMCDKIFRRDKMRDIFLSRYFCKCATNYSEFLNVRHFSWFLVYPAGYCMFRDKYYHIQVTTYNSSVDRFFVKLWSYLNNIIILPLNF